MKFPWIGKIDRKKRKEPKQKDAKAKSIYSRRDTTEIDRPKRRNEPWET